jgi:hypothetical protein
LGQRRGLKNSWAEEEDVFLVHPQNGLIGLILNWCTCENALEIICQYQGIHGFSPNAKSVKEKIGQFFMDLRNEKEHDHVGVLTANFPCLPSQVCGFLLCISSSKYCASYFQC